MRSSARIAGRTGAPSPSRDDTLLDVAPGDVCGGRPHRSRTRSRRSRRRRTSRWRKRATRPSPSSITCITTRRASRTPIPPSSHGASSPPRKRRVSGSRCCPVFYAHGNFGGAATTPLPAALRAQRVHVREAVRDACAAARRRTATCSASRRTACARSRARSCDKIVRLAPAGAPIHIHAAEQTREVDDCYAWSRMRPVEWLLDAGEHRRALVRRPRDPHDRARSRTASPRAARSRASRPTTEADLGDGVFRAETYLQAGGRLRRGHAIPTR